MGRLVATTGAKLVQRAGQVPENQAMRRRQCIGDTLRKPVVVSITRKCLFQNPRTRGRSKNMWRRESDL